MAHKSRTLLRAGLCGSGPAGGKQSRALAGKKGTPVTPSDVVQSKSEQHIIITITSQPGDWIITGIVMSEYINDAEAQGVQPCM